RFNDAVCQDGRAVWLLDADLENGEFISAEPGDDIPFAQATQQPLRGRLQQTITHGVTQRVVDLLEPVKIETQNREAAAAADGAEGRNHLVLQMPPIRQTGKSVVIGQKRDLRLGLTALGDVFMS